MFLVSMLKFEVYIIYRVDREILLRETGVVLPML
jgi:hypothetical protein